MPATKKKSPKKTLKFKYIIPDHIRDCYVNGAWGGVTPRNEIFLHMYSERLPIPKSVEHEIKDPEAALFDKDGKVEYNGDVVRVVQSSVMMDLGTAMAIRDWLNDRIDLVMKRKEEATVQ